MKGTVKHRFIFRHEKNANCTFGWEVRIRRRGPVIGRFFADLAHGGKKKAFAEAKAYRDSLLSAIPEPLPIKTRNIRNRTGIIGVMQVLVKSKHGKIPYWIAYWPLENRQTKRVKFSVQKWGSDAKRMAIEARRQATGKFLK